MNSVKTAFVSLVLLGVLYGMYQVLNAPPTEFDEDGYAMQDLPTIQSGTASTPDVEYGEAIGGAIPSPDAADTGFADYGVGPRTTTTSQSEGGASTGGGTSTGGGAFAGNRSATESPATRSQDAPLAAVPATAADGGSAFQAPELQPELDGDPEGSTDDRVYSFASGFGSGDGSFADDRGRSGYGAAAEGSAAPPSSGATPAQSISTGTSTITAESPIASDSAAELGDAQLAARLEQVWRDVESMVQQERFAEALDELSYFYGDSRLTLEERDGLLTWLDALAARVIYSEEHLLEDAYIVRQGDTLESIAQVHGVPSDLVYVVNLDRIVATQGQLVPGTELKMITGPFRARIDLSDRTMTLFLHNRYAGRFDIDWDPAHRPRVGQVQVVMRYDRGAEFIDAYGNRIAPLEAGNPLGTYIIELSDGTRIHAKDPMQATSGITIPSDDAQDLFSILSVGSRVDIRD